VFRHLVCGAALSAALAGNSWAGLKHRYTFEAGNANDSAPGAAANGTLENGALIIAGQLALPGGGTSITPAPHVALPAATIGINAYPAATLEMWLNASFADNPGFTMGVAFGREGTAADATDPPPTGLANDANEDIFGHDYWMIQPTRGGGGPVRAGITDDYFNSESFVDGPNLRGANQTHVVATMSSTGVDASTLSLYIDGVLIGSQATTDDLADISNSLAYIGRSLYDQDPYFAGTINEFRIYDNAMTPAEVQASFVAGPTGPAGPTLTINRNTGAVSFSNLNTSTRVIEYSINSPVGALDPAAWQPVQGRLDAPLTGGNGSFDGDDSWFVGMQTVNSLAEAMGFDGTADDGALLGATSVALGSGVWEKYYQEDVYATLRVRIDATTSMVIPADVVFTGNSGQAYKRSDLNFDGAINGNDWLLFRTNALTTLTPGLNDVQSYPLGDIDGDQDVDFSDFRLFQGDFVAANGAAAFEALLAGVPEPGSAALVVMGMAAELIRRRRNA
jgi:hypothetical protein